MSPSNTLLDSALPPPAASRPTTKTRPFYWSVRRELWENRSVYIAPLAAAGVVLVGLIIGAFHLPTRWAHMVSTLDPTRQSQIVAIPYAIAATAIMATAFVVAVFYSLGALQSERRDRSILFWKSLPVSDLTTVMSKAVIPLAVLPVVAFVIMLVTLLFMLAVTAVVLPMNGAPATLLLSAFPLGKTTVELAYVLVVFTLWHAPIWGWLMLVSGWARRATFLWAFGPPIVLCVFERLAFGTGYLPALLHYRLTGALAEAFSAGDASANMNHLDLAQMDPLKFMFTPGLWLGLLVAAILFAAAVWQRRYRAPI